MIKARPGDPEKRNKHLEDRSYDLNLKRLFYLAFKLPEALVVHVVQEIPDERRINADCFFFSHLRVLSLECLQIYCNKQKTHCCQKHTLGP